MVEALGLALEALDARLLAQKTEGISVHDVRSRTLATEIGDVGFSLRRYRDRFGEDVYLLADALDIPYGCRISPGAQEFLVQSASLVSYAKAAKLLARHGSSVKATSVMRSPRDAGALCAADDEKAARELYRDGVLPGGETCARELCMEADGTYFRAQGLPDGAPKRFEVKAMCAYAGKEGLSRSLCKSFHRNLSILALMPSSHSSWLRTRAQPGWWHPSPHLEYSSFTRR